MAIFYIDFINGNDANDGTTWANAWKTTTNGATAARIAPGDVIRFAKSPDPTSLGSAVWTDKKIGNSITFSSAPTKQIDTCKAGWVGLTGGTVTNGQSTAYVTPVAPGGAMGALQVVTSATTTLAYKNLGSAQDFSGHQQVSFWFRPATAFDCSGAQNMYINLCSGTGGSTVVNQLALPKWSYTANVWHPIVIDAGSALGSSIQSVSITTTSNTSQTFYFDEMFASPAGGLTLHSLIANNNTLAGPWYAIKAVRDADVWLLGCYSASTAAGANNITGGKADISWAGTTGTYTTYKRETTKPLASTGPSGTPTGQLDIKDSGNLIGSTVNNITYSGGWNTSTSKQDGDTFIDYLTQQQTLHISNSLNYIRLENFIAVRTGSTTFTMTNCKYEFANLGLIATQGSFSTDSVTFDTGGFQNKTYSVRYVSGAQNFQIGGPSAASPGLTFNIGEIWGNGTGSAAICSSGAQSTINIARFSSPDTNVRLSFGNSTTGYDNTYTVGVVDYCTSTSAPNGAGWPILDIQGAGHTVNISSIAMGSANSAANYAVLFGAASHLVVNCPSLTGNSAFVACQAGSQCIEEVVVNGLSFSGSLISTASLAGLQQNAKMYFHNFGGVPGASVIKIGLGNIGDAGTFSLQNSDTHTAGSSAWKYSSPQSAGIPQVSVGGRNNLKLASVAAEANKLVTVSCWVKRSVAHNVGIKVDAARGFVPGYTSDITANCTGSTGSWEQVTLTFTPTANCVFDVWAEVGFTSTTAVTCVWDDLSVTQAA